jgi:hypothetical protein
MKVPVEATRKVRKGNVSALKDGYRRLAPITATVPMAVPMTPPIDPPLIVALPLSALPLSQTRWQGWAHL